MSRSKAKVVDMFTAEVNPDALRLAHWATTDIANAKAFVDEYGDDLRFDHGSGRFLEWTEGRWRRDLVESVAAKAQEHIKRRWKEIGCAGSPEEREILAKHLLASGRAPRLQALLKMAAQDPRIALAPDAFDRDEHLLTVRNGTVDLRTGVLHPHRREDLITKRSPEVYDPATPCLQFLQFLNLIFDGNQSLIDFTQVMAGYSATGSVKEQCLVFPWGGGANGKSTLLDILHAVLGEYARTAAPSLLMASKHDAHPTEIADLLGARLVSAIETERGRHLAEVKVKWLTGGDRLKARFMRQDYFEFAPTHTFWLAGNYKPVIAGQDPAIWRRLYLLPFVVNLEERLGKDNLVRGFASTLTNELPGVLAWIVQGAVRWYAEGLRPPDAVLAATASYRAEMDSVGQWIDEACERDAHARTPFKMLFDAYQADLKGDAISKREFAEELDRLGIHTDKIGGIAFRFGVRLRGVPG